MTEAEVEVLFRSLGTLKPGPSSEQAEQRAVVDAVSSYVESRLQSLSELNRTAPHLGAEQLAVSGALAAFRQPSEAPPARAPQLMNGPANDNMRRLRLSAAAVVLVAFGAALGWGIGLRNDGASMPDLVVAEARSAYSLYGSDNRYRPDSGEEQTKVLGTWLSDRLKRKVDIAALAPPTFQLASAVLLPSKAAVGDTALEMIFRDNSGQSVAVYVTSAAPGTQTSRQQAAEGGAEAFFWANDKITCTIIGDLGGEDMKAVAAAFYQKLAQPGDPNYTGERV